jgi:hypothetical protein
MAEYARNLSGDTETDRVWSDFIATVQFVTEHQADQAGALPYRLEQMVKQHYPVLMQSPKVQQALADCPKRQAPNMPSWSTILFENPACQVNLVAVYRRQGLPLHDHTGSSGLSMILEGRVRIGYARRMGMDPATGLTHVRVAGVQECAAQQTSWFDQQHNLHSIEAISARAVLLVLHLPPVNRASQAFYFPLEQTPWSAGQCIQTKRIRVRYNMGH